MTDIASVRAELDAVLRRTASINAGEIDLGGTGPFAVLEEPLRTAVTASFSVMVRHGATLSAALDDVPRIDLLIDESKLDTNVILPDAIIDKYQDSSLSIREKIDQAIAYYASRESITAVAEAHDSGVLAQTQGEPQQQSEQRVA